MTWKSDTKHQGFVIDMGPNSPFDPPDIIGGSAKPVTTTAKTGLLAEDFSWGSDNIHNGLRPGQVVSIE